MRQAKLLVTIFLITGFVILLPLNIAAQISEWTRVQALRPGTDVLVLRKNGSRVVGYLQGSTVDSIAVTTDSGSFVIAKDNVKKIFYAERRDKMKSMNRGALIGMGAGVIAAIAVTGLQEQEGGSHRGTVVFLASGLLGGLLGAKHGSGTDKGPLIYAAR